MKAKKTAPVRALCVLLAAVALLSLVVPGIAQFQWSDRIERFERYDPVYDEAVDAGTVREDLHLPDTLRAIVGIPEDMDVTTFVQAEPVADNSTGYEEFDYYWYGYVAPRDVESLYAAGELAVYSIHYYNGETAYRVYGSIEGSETLWFACDENGAITGAVLDIPVEWSGSYDADTAGEYTFTAKVSAESPYHWGGKSPTALVVVNQSEEDADHDADQDDQPDQELDVQCTCGAQPDEEGVILHTEDCPLYAPAEEDEIHCTCEVGQDTASAEHDESCPYYQAEELLCTCALASNERGPEHDESCPCYIRVAEDCHCGPDGVAIDADNFPWAHLETCKYFSPIECMCREQVEVEVQDYDEDTGEYTTRIDTAPGDFSHIHDPNNIDCPLYGRDTVRFRKLATDEESVMAYEDAEKIIAFQNRAAQLNTAQQAAQAPAAVIVSTPEGHDSAPDDSTPATDPNVIIELDDTDAAPDDGETTPDGDGGEKEAAGNDMIISADENDYTSDAATVGTGDGSLLYPVLGRIELIPGSEQSAGDAGLALMANFDIALYAAGTNEQKMDAIVKDSKILPTSGSQPTASGTSGAWLDYVRTRFRNMYDNWTWANNASSYRSWKFSGTTATSYSGDITTNSLRIPSRVGKHWDVYSGEQFRYALANYVKDDTIYLKGNLNLNGTNKNWEPLTLPNRSVTINGNGYTIYNLGMLTKKYGRAALYSSSGNAFTIQNLTFSNVKAVFHVPAQTPSAPAGAQQGAGRTGLFVFNNRKALIEKVHIINSLFAQTSPTAGAGGGLGAFGFLTGKGDNPAQWPFISKCSVEDTIVGGLGHPGAFTTFADHLKVEWSCALNNHIYSLAEHHGGLFVSCNAHACNISNCISSGEMYSAQQSGGFIGSLRGGFIENCAATGKLETYIKSGGFTFDATGGEYIKNCYTTVLVGLRSDVSSMAGFIGSLWNGTNLQIENCYAAGEVGDFSLDLTKSSGCGSGGFVAGLPSATSKPFTIKNCYYDKQTTGMREWVLGNGKTLSGVTGLLTGISPKNITAANPNGYGMASGQDFGLGNSGIWKYGVAQHYPQLKSFADATTANWGSEEMANKVKAYSLASTATVFLNTWEEGYDWDQYGTRSKSTVSYNRAASDYHAGNTTYDTVREVILPFTATAGTWTELVKNGVGASISDGKTTKTGIKDTIKITKVTENGKEVNKGTVNNPGMNWFSVSNSTGGQTGSRPLRLISYMSMDAGQDKTVAEDSRYNHRLDVKLTMINELKDNMIVGLKEHEDMDWSTANTRGYPTVSNTDGNLSTKYYSAPTDHTNHLNTKFSASKGAVLNTEIWRLDSSGTPAYSVKVTGQGTSSGDATVKPTWDELMWNGLKNFPTSDDESRRYQISYYWMLKDGRYITDSKVITLQPGTRTLTVNAYDASDRSQPNDTSLLLAAGIDAGADASYAPALASSKQTDSLPFGTNVTAAWRKVQEDVNVTGIQIQFLDNDGNEIAKQTLNAADLKEGTPITLKSVPYYYLTLVDDAVQGKREISASATANVTYTVQKDEQGNYYLRFNKLVNGSEGEYGTADGVTNIAPNNTDTDTSTSTDIAEVAKSVKINDLHYNVVVSLYVEELAHITVKKVVEGYTAAMAEQHFVVDLSGGVNAQFDLTHDQSSLPVTVKAGQAKTIRISEIVPMEFGLKDIQMTNKGAGTDPKFDLTHSPDGTITGGTLTIYPGNDILITVTNQFTASGYFKDRAQVSNEFTH